MISNYQLNEAEITNALKLHREFSTNQLVSLKNLAVFLILISVLVHENMLLVGGIIMFAITIMLVMSAPIFGKLRCRGYRSLRCERIFEFTEEGVNFKDEKGIEKLSWGDVKKWKYQYGILLIYGNSKSFHVVPSRVIQNLQGIIDKLVKNVGPNCA